MCCLIGALASGAADAQEEVARNLPRVHALGRAVPLAALDADICAAACLDRGDFLIDALATRPGLTIRQTGRFGGAASVRVRGAPAGHTLVLIDGVRINDASTPGGAYDFSRLGNADIARVEIYKGAQALLRGAGAGAINVVSREPPRGRVFAASVLGGSFETLAGRTSASIGGDRASATLALHGLTTGGISKAAGGAERDGFTRRGMSAHGRINASARTQLRAGVRYAAARTEYDGFDAVAPGFVADGDQVGYANETLAHGGLSWRTGGLHSDILAAYTRTVRRDEAAGLPTFDARASGYTLRYHGGISSPGGHSSAFGAGWYRSDALGERADTLSLFGVHEATCERTTITAGVRAEIDTRHGARAGMHVDIARHVGSWLVLRAGWGRGHIAPTPYQRTAFFAPATAPADADLNVETTQGWSVGADWQSGGASARLSAFARQADMQIAFRDGRYINLDHSASWGMEMAAAIDLGANVRADGSVTALTATHNGAPARDLPRLTASGRLSVHRGRFLGALLIRHVGAHDQYAGRAAGWTRLDLSVRYQAGDRIEIFARAENLLGLAYQEVVGYGTPGLALTAGARVNARR